MKSFDWITTFLHEFETPLQRVSDVVPDLFDKYFLIHWDVGIIPDFPFESFPDASDDVDVINERVLIQRRFNLLFNNKKEQLYQKTTVKNIAEKFNVPYNYNTMELIKKTPGLAYLETSSNHSLQSSLETLSGNQRLNIYIENSNYEYNKDPISLESVTVTGCMALMKDYGFDTSTYVFPEGLSWCLATTEDFPLILGVKLQSMEALDAFEMELFEVNYDEKLHIWV